MLQLDWLENHMRIDSTFVDAWYECFLLRVQPMLAGSYGLWHIVSGLDSTAAGSDPLSTR